MNGTSHLLTGILPMTVAALFVAALSILAPCAGAQCQDKLISSDGNSGDEFGTAMGVSGDRLAISAIHTDGSNGAAYLYSRQSEVWVEDLKLQPGDAGGSQHFGTDLSFKGDVLLVGAPRDDEAARNAGAAYVFRFDGTNWIEEQKLLPTNPKKTHGYGYAVSLDGDLAVVGAKFDDEGATTAGAAFVYRFDGSQWNLETKLIASDAATNDQFGSDVQVHNGRIMVGSPLRDLGGETKVGSVYLFENVGGSWSETQILEPNDPQALQFFGTSISLFGDLAVIGSPEKDEGGGDSGAVYLFREGGSQWTFEQKLVSSDNASGDHFGESVTWNGQRIVVGAPERDDPVSGDSGVGGAYVFEHDGSSWIEEKVLTAPDADELYYYGSSVELVGADAVVGASGADTLNLNHVGAAYGLSLLVKADWENYGAGHPGTHGIPGISLSGDPILGSSVDLLVENSRGTQTFAFVFLGFSKLNITTNRGGILLVKPWRTFTLSIPANGLTLPFDLPCLEGLAGASVFLQGIMSDPGASHGFAFTPGLEMVLGNF